MRQLLRKEVGTVALEVWARGSLGELGKLRELELEGRAVA